MTASADAAEEAFLRGEWVAALALSKQALSHRMLQTNDALAAAVCTTSSGADDERLLSVYLQSIFELDLTDEVATATGVVDALEPLASDVAIQWVKFLIAMNERDAAAAKIALLLATPHLPTAAYGQLIDVLYFQLLLPVVGVVEVRKRINADERLDDPTKQHFRKRVDAMSDGKTRVVAQTAVTPTAQPAAQATQSAVARTHRTHVASTTIGNSTSAHALDDETSSTYVWIGSAALAVAVAAVGAVRYKDRVWDVVEGVGPALSKGLADAKYALFEA